MAEQQQSGGAAGMQAPAHQGEAGTLTESEFLELQRGYGQASSRPLANKYLCVMLNRRAGWQPQSIANFLGVSEPPVLGCIAAFRDGGINKLNTLPNPW